MRLLQCFGCVSKSLDSKCEWPRVPSPEALSRSPLSPMTEALVILSGMLLYVNWSWSPEDTRRGSSVEICIIHKSAKVQRTFTPTSIAPIPGSRRDLSGARGFQRTSDAPSLLSTPAIIVRNILFANRKGFVLRHTHLAPYLFQRASSRT